MIGKEDKFFVSDNVDNVDRADFLKTSKKIFYNGSK